MSAEHTPSSKPHSVWRLTEGGAWTLHGRYRWRWLADFVAWERTKRGWFKYEVRDA